MTRTAIIESFKRFFKIENRFIDEYEQLLIDWAEELTKSKSATCEANAQSVLSEVRAIEKALDIMDELIKYHAHYCDVEMPEEKAIREKAIVAIKKISEHFR